MSVTVNSVNTGATTTEYDSQMDYQKGPKISSEIHQSDPVFGVSGPTFPRLKQEVDYIAKMVSFEINY